MCSSRHSKHDNPATQAASMLHTHKGHIRSLLREYSTAEDKEAAASFEFISHLDCLGTDLLPPPLEPCLAPPPRPSPPPLGPSLSLPLPPGAEQQEMRKAAALFLFLLSTCLPPGPSTPTPPPRPIPPYLLLLLPLVAHGAGQQEMKKTATLLLLLRPGSAAVSQVTLPENDIIPVGTHTCYHKALPWIRKPHPLHTPILLWLMLALPGSLKETATLTRRE